MWRCWETLLELLVLVSYSQTLPLFGLARGSPGPHGDRVCGVNFPGSRLMNIRINTKPQGCLDQRFRINGLGFIQFVCCECLLVSGSEQRNTPSVTVMRFNGTLVGNHTLAAINGLCVCVCWMKRSGGCVNVELISRLRN